MTTPRQIEEYLRNLGIRNPDHYINIPPYNWNGPGDYIHTDSFSKPEPQYEVKLPTAVAIEQAKPLKVIREKPAQARPSTNDDPNPETVPISEAEFRSTFKRPVRRLACLGQSDTYYFLSVHPTEEEVEAIDEWFDKVFLDSKGNCRKEI